MRLISIMEFIHIAVIGIVSHTGKMAMELIFSISIIMEIGGILIHVTKKQILTSLYRDLKIGMKADIGYLIQSINGNGTLTVSKIFIIME